MAKSTKKEPAKRKHRKTGERLSGGPGQEQSLLDLYSPCITFSRSRLWESLSACR